MVSSALAPAGPGPAGSDWRRTASQQVAPIPPLHGLAGPYTDPRSLTGIEFGQHSHWLQPWRSVLETVPAAQFLSGVGVGFPAAGDLDPELVARMLSSNGVRTVRVEIGWGNLDFGDESKLNTAEHLSRVLKACARWKLRPLILLNLHQGVPGPLKMFGRRITQDAAPGARQITLDDVRGLVPGRSGSSDISDYWAAEVLITAIKGNTVTLSKPLPGGVRAGKEVRMATLKYRPFSRPGSADYVQTMAGWTRYVGTVATFAARQLGSAGRPDLGFDLEIYNELTFGQQFLSINNYYQPPLEDYDEESIWANLVAATAQYAEEHPQQFAGAALSNGFGSTIPWTASSVQPERIGAISKHPYHGISTFPADEAKGAGLGQTGAATTAVPRYTALLPEYYGTALQTETLLRDSSPLKTSIYGTVHGRFGRGASRPVPVWITEVNIAPGEAGVTAPAAAQALKARSAARYFSFYLNKGVQRVYLYTAADSEANGESGFDVLPGNFVQYARTHRVYPQDDGPYTSPALSVVRRLTGAFQNGLDPALKQTRPLTVRSVRDRHDHIQFAAVEGQPPLHNREVLAVLPYQVNARRFVIAYYVMTRDLRQTLAAEDYTVELGGLNAAGADISVYDPVTGSAVPVKVHAREQDKLSLTLSATDTPRLLVVQER
jgi:hypothetical protein